jgi:hypothetical protein
MERQLTNEQHVREQVREALGTVRPLVTMSRDGLVITALEWGTTGHAAYETATAASVVGDLELREQGSGDVPTIEAVTKTKPVVIFAGDTVVGGRQNRIINITVWLPAAAVTAIPVSCLELGRWNQGHGFSTSRKVDYLMRARMSDQLADVAMSERQHAAAAPGHAPAPRSYAANQGEVWQEISAKEARFGVHSRTSALHDLYEHEAIDLGALVRAFPCPAGATGIAVGIGGRLVAAELFDAPSTLAEQWPRLVEGAASAYADHRRAVDAGIAPKPAHRYPDEGSLGRMLERAGASVVKAVVGPSVGEGFDVRLAGTRVRGGALVANGHPVHLELFRVEAQ